MNDSPTQRPAWDGIAVHFSEIALKGGNRRHFVDALQANIQRLLKGYDVKVRNLRDRLLIKASDEAIPEILPKVACVCGVSHAVPIRTIPADLDAIRAVAIDFYRKTCVEGATFAVRCKRSDKSFPLTSSQFEREIGGAVHEATGAPVDLTNPDVLIRFRIHDQGAFLEEQRVQGPDGLPVGVTDKVLALFSGGIDSPPAGWMMMKRGCRTDYIHFHTFADPEKIRETKIVRLIEALGRPQGLTPKLHLVPYHPFEMALLTAQVPQGLELVLFRRFMARVASAVARRKRYAAIVTGDNLSQVASQTMRNLTAFDEAASRMVFRPLLAYNKQDIIALAKKIGTFDLSVEPYKDCCSIVAKHPETRPRLKDIHDAESALPIDDMTNNALDEMVVWTV